MSKVAVVFWSGTGNTQAMAEAVAEGAKDGGAEVTVYGPSEFSADLASGFDGIAFGCPAMGAENLEEDEFEPMFQAVEDSLGGKKVALFGSYGWGDGTWMREWEERCGSKGITLATESVMANETPGAAEIDACKALGAALA